MDQKKPGLLVTDYRCLSMPVDQFMYVCRRVHPKIRILMASGFDLGQMRFFRARPDGFIQKPFTPEEFLQKVRATLVE
jgi:DNA-binding response OmpR family regulator